MSLFRSAPPRLPAAPGDYEPAYFDALLSTLRLYFNQINNVQQINVSKLNISLDTLPTEADVANLRAGDVYRDTTASTVLKVKV